jgi:DNA-directed RNA polymerase specialized sigma24 family protein
MSSQEVAKILGLKDGALRVRTFRVMQKMKDIFEALYGKRN